MIFGLLVCICACKPLDDAGLALGEILHATASIIDGGKISIHDQRIRVSGGGALDFDYQFGEAYV